MIGEAIRALLLGDGSIAGIVGGARIFPLMMPQGERGTSLVYQRIGRSADHHLDGPDGIVDRRLQINAWAVDPDQAAALIDRVEQLLDGFSGVVAYGDDSPQLACDIRGIFLDRELQGYDGEARLWSDGRHFRVMHMRAPIGAG